MWLQPDQMSIATEARDYPEWHHGRPHYALWYIEIQHVELLNYLQQLRLHFSDLLLQPNTRQFHISLFICGFWKHARSEVQSLNSIDRNQVNSQVNAHDNSPDNSHHNSHHNTEHGAQVELQAIFNDDFQLSQFQQQCRAIQQKLPITLRLRSGKLNSFESALMLEIVDPQAGLTQLKTILAQYGHEVAALEYCPHITLGLYANQFSYAEIAERIAEIEQKSFEIHVDKIHFGYYATQELQGKLYSQHHIELEKLCCNLS